MRTNYSRKNRSRPARYLTSGAILAVTVMLCASGTNAATKKAKTSRTKPKTATTVVPKASATAIPLALIGYALPKSVGGIDLTKLPLGDSRVSLTAASVGGIWACRIDPNAGGARVVGPWINVTAGTFDYTAKYIVDGDVSWAASSYTSSVQGDRRVFASNDLPKHTTGNFPIAATDDAYQIDRNPWPIQAQSLSFSVPASPTENASPNCTPGEVGITLDGVMILDALDAPGRDAVAHETQDHCDGHPNQAGYHYHNLSRCITENADGSGRHVGWILDGFPLMSRIENGKVVTNEDLDECHGHVGKITIDGKAVTTYHYHATYEFPYTVGCMKGTPTRLPRTGAPAGAPGLGGPPATPKP